MICFALDSCDYIIVEMLDIANIRKKIVRYSA